MNRLFFLCLVFFAFTRLADAHLQMGPSGIAFNLPGAQYVYLARVSSIRDGKVIFSITQVLRGKSQPSLILTPYRGSSYKQNSEWFLVSTGEDPIKSTVGWATVGDCGWLPAGIMHVSGKYFLPAQFVPDGVALDSLPDGTKGLTLDHIKELLKQKPKP